VAGEPGGPCLAGCHRDLAPDKRTRMENGRYLKKIQQMSSTPAQSHASLYISLPDPRQKRFQVQKMPLRGTPYYSCIRRDAVIEDELLECSSAPDLTNLYNMLSKIVVRKNFYVI